MRRFLLVLAASVLLVSLSACSSSSVELDQLRAKVAELEEENASLYEKYLDAFGDAEKYRMLYDDIQNYYYHDEYFDAPDAALGYLFSYVEDLEGNASMADKAVHYLSSYINGIRPIW